MAWTRAARANSGFALSPVARSVFSLAWLRTSSLDDIKAHVCCQRWCSSVLPNRILYLNGLPWVSLTLPLSERTKNCRLDTLFPDENQFVVVVTKGTSLWAENSGFGFELPSVVLNVPKKEDQSEAAKAA